MRSLLALLLVAACGSDAVHSEFPGGGDTGTGFDPGGAQDIGAAREIIANGGVPQGDMITVEGLFSEHDVPAVGPPCTSPLCLRPGVGVAPSLETGRLERWVHVGMTSGIDLSTWRRPPVDLVIAIDKSSSMTIDMTETTEAAARLVGHLREDDRVAVLAFDGSVHVLHELGGVANKAGLQSQIRGLDANGSWDIDMALDASYARLA